MEYTELKVGILKRISKFFCGNVVGALTNYRVCILMAFMFFIVDVNSGTFELWPAEQRANNTAYLIGNEQNHLLFVKSDRSTGGHKIIFPEKMEKENLMFLVVDLPEDLRLLCVYAGEDKKTCTDKVNVIHDGKPFIRYEIPLNNALAKNKEDYFIAVWVKPSVDFIGEIYWELKYDDNILASASSHLITVGVIDSSLKLPKRFELSFFGLINKVPDDDFQRFSDFCRRLGIVSALNYYSGELSPEKKSYYTELRKAGIKNIAVRSGEFMYLIRGFSKQKETMDVGGLEAASAKLASMIDSQAERNLFEKAAEYFDEYDYDYEPTGPRQWDGYDDNATIEAFARNFDIKEPLTPELLKGKYREQYIKYRMELLCRPIFALKNMIDSVKPVPLHVDQGDGLNAHIDYKLYDSAVRWHRPMIYTTSPTSYYQRMLAITGYLDSKKVMPNVSIGYHFSGIIRQSPEGLVMDTVATAAAGCGGISHWPDMFRGSDQGGFWGFYRGMTIVAHGEDFYFDGKSVNIFAITGIPFKPKKINLGVKTIDISEPDWNTTLFYHLHSLKDEYLITLLNYNPDYNAFVKISGEQLAEKYLVNPIEKTYLKVNDAKDVMVNVPKFSPALWIVTSDTKRIDGCRQLIHSDIMGNFEIAKKEFLNSGNSDLQLGQSGAITTGYGMVEVGGKETTVLNVSTPYQKLSFSNSGGRILSWKIGNKEMIGKKDFSNGGFCKDLLWLPANARWSGDEVRDMKLIKCTNDGKNVIVQYEGEFKNGLPNVCISKTYIIPADNASLNVNIRLRNETPLPVTLSYWSHNMLPFNNSIFVNSELDMDVQGDSVFISKSLPERFMQSVINEPIKGKTDNIYAEFVPQNKTGIIFKLPSGFMNIYRWRSQTLDSGSSEWMSCPITIEPGLSASMDFSIEIDSDSSVKKLKDRLFMK